MFCGCILTYPSYLAIHSKAFTEYLLQAFKIYFCDETMAFIVQKLIAFSVACLFYIFFFVFLLK